MPQTWFNLYICPFNVYPFYIYANVRRYQKNICIEVEINAVYCNLFRAIFDLGSKGSFWICLLGIQIAAVVPRFVIKMFIQHCKPSDIQIAREAEKFGNSLELRGQEVEMNPPRR